MGFKILIIDRCHYVRGGAERYAMELSELLELRGHQVIQYDHYHAILATCEELIIENGSG